MIRPRICSPTRRLPCLWSKTEDAGYIAHALGVVARAKGMTQIANETGLSREQLYRSFSTNGNPTLKTTIAVMKALGIELTAKPHIQ